MGDVKTYSEHIESGVDVCDPAVTWAVNKNLPTKTVYRWEWIYVTTYAIYTLLTDDDINIINSVGENVKFVDFSGMNHRSIPNKIVHDTVYSMLTMAEEITK